MYEAELKSKRPILFALTTCPRCERIKVYLRKKGVDAIFVDVDMLPGDEKRRQLEFLQQVNPRVSFPTLVVGEYAVLGEDYESLQEALSQ